MRSCTNGTFSAWTGSAGADTCVETVAFAGSFSNDSVGDQARVEWEAPDALAVRLLLSADAQVAQAWKGETSAVPEGTIVSDQHSACTGNAKDDAGAVAFPASRAYHASRAGSMSAFASADKCGIDLSGIAPWETRYLRLHVVLPGAKVARSRVITVAHVPRGMVFVAKDDWPDDGPQAGQAFDFAIDKFTASHEDDGVIDWAGIYPSNASTLVLESARGREASFLPWSAAKTGCESRNDSVPAAFLGSGAPTRVHLATDLEWFIGAAGTPLAQGGACYAKDPATGSDDPLTGAPSRKGCLSRYGAWEMANTFENVDAVVVADAPVSGVIALTKTVFLATPAAATSSHTMPSGTDDGSQWGGYVTGFAPLSVLPTSLGTTGAPAFGDATFRVRTAGGQRALTFTSRYGADGYTKLNDTSQGGFSAFARCAVRKP